VDDHSTDNSMDILDKLRKKYDGIIVVLNPLKGGNNARNYGFSISSGDFIQWLDADDALLGGKLDTQLLFMINNPSVDIAYSDWRLDTYNESRILCQSEYKQLTNYSDYLEELLKDNWAPPHVYLLKREAAQRAININGWDSATRVAQDREFFTKVALTGATFGYAKGTFAVYNRRLNMQSVSRSMSAESKARHIIQMLNCFLELLERQDWISDIAKNKYKRILITQILYYVSIYNIQEVNSEFSFKNTNWSQIKGYRSKLKMLVWLLTNKQ